MTTRLFDKDPYLKSFDARIVSCAGSEDPKRAGLYEIILDQTAFYPEGGGQAGDTGMLGETVVTDTQERGGEIIHFTNAPLAVGNTVTGTIDWEARFDRMQNHTGEHIVSGLIHEAYGFDNVGFHMGSDVLTIDLSGILSMEQLRVIEEKANQVVWNDVPVETAVYPDDEAASLTFRSKKELHGLVRIVTIPGADVCACCGTHVRRTGEIGLIRLLSAEHFRGGVRIEMVCGKRAYSYLSRMDEQNHLISVALSVPPEKTASAVERIRSEREALSGERAALERRLFRVIADNLPKGEDCFLIEPGLTPDGIRRLAVEIMETTGGQCFVFSGTDADGYRYAGGKTGGDVRSFVKEMNLNLKGRGGGKPFFVQGSAACTEQEIAAFFKKADK